MISIFDNQCFMLLTKDIAGIHVGNANPFAEPEIRTGPIMSCYVLKPDSYGNAVSDNEIEIKEFETAEEANKDMILSVIEKIKQDPLFPNAFKYFKMQDNDGPLFESQYCFQINRAIVYIAKASRRGMANHVVANQKTADYFDLQYKGKLVKDDNVRYPILTYEIHEWMPDNEVLMAYRPEQTPIDFPVAYSKYTKRRYTHLPTYMSYFALVDFNK